MEHQPCHIEASFRAWKELDTLPGIYSFFTLTLRGQHLYQIQFSNEQTEHREVTWPNVIQLLRVELGLKSLQLDAKVPTGFQ